MYQHKEFSCLLFIQKKAKRMCATGPTCKAEGLCVVRVDFFCHPVWEPVQDLFLLAVSSCCEYISAFLKASVQLKG